MVIKNLPKLEGFIHPLPDRAYAGDLRHLVLELRNRSEFSVKNLKMKISNPRFLSVGNHDDLMKEFPACLQKKANTEQSGANDNFSKMTESVFSFPEDTSIQGETPLSWPLWLRAAVPGNISLYITIYYELSDVSSIIKYRMLRMHYDLQVLPSLNVSFQVSPCPSRLQQYLVRMDLENQTSSENFQIHQLSSVGHHWEISLLQPFDSIFPSQSLFAGQALSCFFVLKNRGKSLTSSDKISSHHPLVGVDVSLQGSVDTLFDISGSPLADFHYRERLQQGVSQDDPNAVDFILISWSSKSNIVSGNSDPLHLFSYHACHCSTLSKSPITWLVDGPRIMHHNFDASFCEVNLKMTIYNSSDAVAYVCVNTIDSPPSSGQSSDATALQSNVPSANQAGWHEIPVLNDIKVTSQLTVNPSRKLPPLESVSAFIWSGASTTSVHLEPMSAAKIAMKICVFSPGIYDVSNYALNWELSPGSNPENEAETRQISGTCCGYPYYLTVLQSA